MNRTDCKYYGSFRHNSPFIPPFLHCEGCVLTQKENVCSESCPHYKYDFYNAHKNVLDDAGAFIVMVLTGIVLMTLIALVI